MASPNETPAIQTLAADALGEYLSTRLGDEVVDVTVAYDQLTLNVTPEAFAEAARLCKEDPALDFDFFDFLAGVDLGEEGFAVVAHLYSVTHRHHVTLRTVAAGGREAPKVPTLTHLYRGADWHERETYDMFGIDFDGHPSVLPRILTVENFEGFPLRKEFLLSTREAKPWPGLKEPKEVGEDEEEKADATAEQAPVSAEEKREAGQTRADRARAKAAAMRAQKRERAAAEQQPEGGDKKEEQGAAQEATVEEADDAAARDADEPADAQAAAAEATTGGDTAGESAAAAAAAAGEPEPQTPEGAAEIADTGVAKDAAAGTVGGDTAAGATQDAPDTDEPVIDEEAEARVGEGAPPASSGTPGPEAEGLRGGAEQQGFDAPVGDSQDVEDAEEPSETLDEAGRLEEPPPPEENER